MKKTINIDELLVNHFGDKIVIYSSRVSLGKDAVVNFNLNGYIFVKDCIKNQILELNNGATLTKGDYEFYAVNNSQFKIRSFTSIVKRDSSFNNCEFRINAPYELRLQVNSKMVKEFLDYSFSIRDSKRAMSLESLKDDCVLNINKYINHVISDEEIEETVNLSSFALDVSDKVADLLNDRSGLTSNGIAVLEANIQLLPESEYFEKKKEILFLRSI